MNEQARKKAKLSQSAGSARALPWTATAASPVAATAPAATRGETSSAAYFILSGSVGVGMLKGDDYVMLSTLREGDFFGEVAALTGRARTANVITEEPSQFLIIPAKVLRKLTSRYADLRDVFYTTMTERLSVTDLPLGTALDQNLLKELRTASAEE